MNRPIQVPAVPELGEILLPIETKQASGIKGADAYLYKCLDRHGDETREVSLHRW